MVWEDLLVLIIFSATFPIAIVSAICIMTYNGELGVCFVNFFYYLEPVIYGKLQSFKHFQNMSCTNFELSEFVYE